MFRYRQLTHNLADPQRVGGDMNFGRGIRNFLIDSPTAVAQAILTRLNLWQGEWFLNLSEGMPWMQQILGHPPGGGIPDSAIRARILGTPFVRQLYDYASTYNSTARSFTVSAKVITQFGQITEAPAGAFIAPSGALVLPLRPLALNQPTDVLAAPQRRLPTPDGF